MIVETFNDGALTGWTGGTIATNNADLGPYLTSASAFNNPASAASSLGIVGTQDVHKTFDLSGNQTSVTIAFTFNRIDSWDGEQFRIWVNDSIVSSNTFTRQLALTLKGQRESIHSVVADSPTVLPLAKGTTY
jgi:hypothetical protein